MKKKLLSLLMFCLLLCSMSTAVFGAEKEEYPYYVTVNLTENIVTIYEKDDAGEYTVPVRAFLCSVGESTPEGTFQTQVKYSWRYLFGDVWGQYATRITGHYLFHSVPYFEKDKSTLEYEEYNKLGTTASMGCIRLTVEAAKWIYDNCPVGTTVEMYHGDVEEPLQPEAVQKINVNDTVKRGWDPTDPSEENPWRKGEMRQMQPSWFGKDVEAYYENGTYYLNQKDAEKLFSQVDIKLNLEETEVKDGKATVLYEDTKGLVSCRVKDGEVYYKIRDLAEMADAEMSWNGKIKEISLQYGEKAASITYGPVIKDVVSLPAKMAAFFFG